MLLSTRQDRVHRTNGHTHMQELDESPAPVIVGARKAIQFGTYNGLGQLILRQTCVANQTMQTLAIITLCPGDHSFNYF